MGFFSWKTADTQEPIRNVYSGSPRRTVYMLQPGGKPPIEEKGYEGYGVFGGVDAYEWLARKNLPKDEVKRLKALGGEELRHRGISLECDERLREALKFPLKFSFDVEARYEKLPTSEVDPDQGCF